MAEEKDTQTKKAAAAEVEAKQVEKAAEGKAASKQADTEADQKSDKNDNKQRPNRRGPRNKRREQNKEDDPYDHRLIKIRRVSRMYHGGRRMRFSTFVVVGDREGHVGLGSAKGQDIPFAQAKARRMAVKSLVNVPLKGNTIPHAIEYKYKSTTVLLMPAAPGTGVVAGSTVKAVAELAGIKDLLTKVLGSTNPINTAYATVEALSRLRETRTK